MILKEKKGGVLLIFFIDINCVISLGGRGRDKKDWFINYLIIDNALSIGEFNKRGFSIESY